MTPVINNEIFTFRVIGLYNGLAVLADTKTNSWWDHITGECFHGEHLGEELPIAHPMQYTTAEQLLRTHRDAKIAISTPTLKSRALHFIFLRKMLKGFLPGLFYKSMTETNDHRRPELDLGVGVWIEGGISRYYPVETLKACGNAIIDTIDGQRILIMIDPVSRIGQAYHTNAESFVWDGDDLALNTGQIIRAGQCVDPEGATHRLSRPMQLFSRWYGFAYTFPECGIYGEN